MAYLFGIVAAFFPPVFHGWANVLDHYFTGKVFEQRAVLVFVSNIIGICLLPIVWLFGLPSLVSWSIAVLLLAIALTEFLYVFPYYWALQEADTSVVAALFGLGKVTIPIMAFFFLGERLTVFQYVGFAVLVGSSVVLSADFKSWRLSRSFYLMLGVSILLAVQAILIKYAFSFGITWSTLVTWMSLFELLIAALTMFSTKNRHALMSLFKALDGKWNLFLQMEVVGWLGNMGSYYALAVIPVSVAKGIASTQPAFPLLYASLFSKKHPELFREYLGRDGVVKKLLLFCSIAGGTLLITV